MGGQRCVRAAARVGSSACGQWRARAAARAGSTDHRYLIPGRVEQVPRRDFVADVFIESGVEEGDSEAAV